MRRRNALRKRFKVVLLLGCLFSLRSNAATASPGCMDALPLDAVRQRFQAVVTPEGGATAGRGLYRLLRLEQDRLHDRVWAVIEDCHRPQVPWMAFPVILPAGSVDGLRPWNVNSQVVSIPGKSAWEIRSGDRLHLWRSRPEVRVDLQAIALVPGRVGDRIAMRLAGAGGSQGGGWGGGQATMAYGVVRGPGSVELVEVSGWQPSVSGGPR